MNRIDQFIKYGAIINGGEKFSNYLKRMVLEVEAKDSKLEYSIGAGLCDINDDLVFSRVARQFEVLEIGIHLPPTEKKYH